MKRKELINLVVDTIKAVEENNRILDELYFLRTFAYNASYRDEVTELDTEIQILEEEKKELERIMAELSESVMVVV